MTDRKFYTFIGDESGMFADLYKITAFLQLYEFNLIEGFEIDFGTAGAYYSEGKGPNWWNYYFEPILIGSKLNAEIVKSHYGINYWIPFFQSRQENFNLLNKYVKPKSFVLERIKNFVAIYFNNSFIIGVHWRGTDKSIDASPISYETMLKAVCKFINDNGIEKSNYKIYVATDEEPFISFMIEKFHQHVIFDETVLRSKEINGYPVHINSENPFKAGEDAIFDAMMLSMSSILIRPDSNLSAFSAYFNPNIPVLTLNQRYDYPPQQINKVYQELKARAEVGIPPYALLNNWRRLDGCWTIPTSR
jgi:hypothetical protein